MSVYTRCILALSIKKKKKKKAESEKKNKFYVDYLVM